MPPVAVGLALGASAASAAAVGTMAYIGVAAIGMSMYNSQKAATAQGKAASAAADAQKAVGLAQIEAPLKAEALAAETAKSKLKARQAAKSSTILTPPGLEEAKTTMPGLLGVPQ